eukprot:355233-Chlamydomonas_euryale.AAC.2
MAALYHEKQASWEEGGGKRCCRGVRVVARGGWVRQAGAAPHGGCPAFLEDGRRIALPPCCHHAVVMRTPRNSHADAMNRCATAERLRPLSGRRVGAMRMPCRRRVTAMQTLCSLREDVVRPPRGCHASAMCKP